MADQPHSEILNQVVEENDKETTQPSNTGQDQSVKDTGSTDASSSEQVSKSTIDDQNDDGENKYRL